MSIACVGFEELPQPISPAIAFYFSVETVTSMSRERWDVNGDSPWNLVKLGRDLTRPGPPKGSFLEGKSPYFREI